MSAGTSGWKSARQNPAEQVAEIDLRLRDFDRGWSVWLRPSVEGECNGPRSERRKFPGNVGGGFRARVRRFDGGVFDVESGCLRRHRKFCDNVEIRIIRTERKIPVMDAAEARGCFDLPIVRIGVGIGREGEIAAHSKVVATREPQEVRYRLPAK